MLVVLVAILVLELSVAVLWMGSADQARAGRDALAGVALGAAADGELARIVATWDTLAYDALPVSGAVTLPARSWDAGATAEGVIERLSPALFQVVVAAQRLDGAGRAIGRRRVGLVLRRLAGPGEAGGVQPVQGHAWWPLE